MKTCLVEPDYEPLRTWVLHPSSIRPPGLAHMLRGGIITWMRDTQPPPAVQSSDIHTTRHFSTTMSTIMAAMITEVCR